jgi:hypothetical protein
MASDDNESATDNADAELEERVTRAVKIGLPVAVLVGAVIAGTRLGASGVVLVLAGGALIGVIAAFWTSVRTLFGETPLAAADAYALAAPRAEEEQKRSVLRALKDLEFERSVGKISDEDYQVLVAKYRAEAKRLLRVLDEEKQPRIDSVEAMVRKRLAKEGLLDDAADASESASEKPASETSDDAAKPATTSAVSEKKRKKKKGKLANAPSKDVATEKAEKASGETSSESSEPSESSDANEDDGLVACASCGTKNDGDAVFCKKCGKKCGAPSESEAEAAKTEDP